MKKYFGFVFMLLLVACQSPPKAKFDVPETLSDGWEITTPDREQVDAEALAAIIADIPGDNPKMDALVIARNGKLLVDLYLNGYHDDSLHRVWSISKMVSNMLIGQAQDQQLLSIYDPISKHLQPYTIDSSSSVAGITIEHLITMTSGLSWEEMGGRKSVGFLLPYSEDWIEYTLEQPHEHAPGTVFNYSTGNAMLLAPILKNTTGMQAHEFAEQGLFKALQFTKWQWNLQSQFWTHTHGDELPAVEVPTNLTYSKLFADYTNTGSGLWLRPRDLCKLGQLMLNRGKWQGQQVLSEAWVNESLRRKPTDERYGYHWRSTEIGGQSCFYSTGFGIQRVFVFPEMDLVVATAQSHYQSMPAGRKATDQLLEKLLAVLKKAE